MIEEKILSIAKEKCDEADISMRKSYQSKVSYKSNEINGITSNESSWLALRVIKDGKLGISYSYDLNTDPEKLVDRAIFNSRYGPVCHFSLPDKVTVSQEAKVFDLKTLNFQTKDAKALIETEMKKLLSKEKDLLVGGVFNNANSEARFLNTNGTDYSYKNTSFFYYILGSRNREGDFLSIAEGIPGRKIDKKITTPCKETLKLFNWSRDLRKVKTGKFDVYLGNEVFAQMIQVVLTALNGKNVLMGSSFLKDSLGKKIFDSRIQIMEDPFIDWGVNSLSLDDEGMKTTPKDLIKAGVAKKFIYDLQTAVKAKTKPTGNGFRGISGQASPRFTNIVVSEGKKSEGNIIKSIKNGLYVKGVMGGHVADPYSGNMSLQVELGFRIEDGRVTGRVKNTMIFLNVFDVLRSNLVEMSMERRWEENYYLPGIHLKDISIASK